MTFEQPKATAPIRVRVPSGQTCSEDTARAILREAGIPESDIDYALNKIAQ